MTSTSSHLLESLKKNCVHLYARNLYSEVEIDDKRLALQDRELLQGISHLRRRRELFTSRVLRSEVLNLYLEEDYQVFYSDLKKPYLKDSPLSFNISHSGELVVMAVAYGYEIGIDLERVKERKLDPHFLDRTFAPRELSLIANTADFFTQWTRKEAYLKACGKGVQTHLATIDTYQISDYHFYPLDYWQPGHVAHLVTHQPCEIALKFDKTVTF